MFLQVIAKPHKNVRNKFHQFYISASRNIVGYIRNNEVVIKDADSMTYLQTAGLFGRPFNSECNVESGSEQRLAGSLTYEEGFFLAYALGVLFIMEDNSERIIPLGQLWQQFSACDKRFCIRYIAYHYYRSKGWVVKSGLKFGVDFLLYRESPAVYHSSAGVIVVDGALAETRSWTDVAATARLSESVAKALLICFVNNGDGSFSAIPNSAVQFQGENSKSAQARQRKDAAKSAEAERKKEKEEEEYWRDDDKHAAAKQQRKDEKERKRQDQVNRKLENHQLYDTEQSQLKGKSIADDNKVTRSAIQDILHAEADKLQKQKSTRDEDLLVENVNHLEVEGEVARTVDEAIGILGKGDEPDRHPEKRMKAAYAAFEERRLAQLKAENPSLKLSQLKQMLFKEWQKSPENPINQAHQAYNENA